MFTPIDIDERRWLEGWLLRTHAGYVPSGYDRQVVILHPGARVGEASGDSVPITGPSSVDGEPAPEQIDAIKRALLDASVPTIHAYAAFYDGTPDVPWPGPIGAVATRVETNVVYALVACRLGTLLEHDWTDERFGAGYIVEWVSMLWPDDRAWFLTSDPDSPFTVVACENRFADELLEMPNLPTVELTDYRWDWG